MLGVFGEEHAVHFSGLACAQPRRGLKVWRSGRGPSVDNLCGQRGGHEEYLLPSELCIRRINLSGVHRMDAEGGPFYLTLTVLLAYQGQTDQ